MRNIQMQVAEFFQKCENDMESEIERAVFLNSVAAAIGVFLHNNYEHIGHAEISEVFKQRILSSSEWARKAQTATAHIHINFITRKK